MELERRQADLPDNCFLLFSRQIGQRAALLRTGARFGNDLCDEVVGIYYGAFAGFHLAGGQIDHAVGQVIQAAGVGFLHFFEHLEQCLEVVILLVGHHIHHAGDAEVVVAQASCAQILGDIDRSAVAALQHLLIHAHVFEVDPY